MIKLLLAFALTVGGWTTANAIEICEAQCMAGEVVIVQNVPESRQQTSVVTRWEEVNGKKIPVTEEVTQVVTELVPVVVKKPIGSYRISDIGDQDVGEKQVRAALASKTLVVFMFEELPPAKRTVFKPSTLFLRAKDSPDE